ncbi:MAG: efflux RND transporter periplasmic adaptor subunit [Syntrophomonadaceae bacterium]|nr:efflux RND transporter periplasmic adaptor subunit [Syntrophomonadaceae bacterium]MDH7498099.1 efflux RND transporter periplasmic adaptor subunit [Syntrophomonadaceae bacterium]
MKRRTIVYLLLGLALLGGYAAWMAANSGTQVETAKVAAATITRTVEDTGYVQPASDLQLHARQPGRVLRVEVSVGQQVRRGQTLVVMENLDLAAQVSDTRAALAQAAASLPGAEAAVQAAALQLADAQRTLERLARLRDAEAASQADYDQAQTAVDQGRQALAERQSALQALQIRVRGLEQTLADLQAKQQQLTITSPADGTVLSLPVEREQVLQPGAPLLTLAAGKALEIKADILSDDLADVAVGQPVTVTAPVLGSAVLEGRVREIYPQAEEKTSALGVVQRRVPVIISLADSGVLKPGYEVRVAIETARHENVLVVPIESVRSLQDGTQQVLVVANGRVHFVTVTTGISDGNRVEITGGLKAGETIVRDASLDLKDNARVRTAGSQP